MSASWATSIASFCFPISCKEIARQQYILEANQLH
jgi:hypothetical protein